MYGNVGLPDISSPYKSRYENLEKSMNVRLIVGKSTLSHNANKHSTVLAYRCNECNNTSSLPLRYVLVDN